MSVLPDNWPDVAWRKLPVELRRRAVERLQALLPDVFFEQLRERIDANGLNKWLPLGWHFGQGMGIRNLLRSNHGLTHDEQAIAPILDRELPPMPELYGDAAGEYGNWDDFYIQALEAAAGRRPVEDDG